MTDNPIPYGDEKGSPELPSVSLHGRQGDAPAKLEGIYVASRASTPERPAMWRMLRAAGYPIISTWIDEAGEGETASNRELWQRIELEVTSAARLVLYVEPEDFPLKGAYVEVGMALAAGVPVFVVAPGVTLEPRSLRPLGSWAMHPLVTFCDRVVEALKSDGSAEGVAARQLREAI